MHGGGGILHSRSGPLRLRSVCSPNEDLRIGGGAILPSRSGPLRLRSISSPNEDLLIAGGRGAEDLVVLTILLSLSGHRECQAWCFP